MQIDAARANALNEERLHLIIMPTEKCNCRCTYCYEDFTIGRMSRDLIESIKKLISRRLTGLTSLHIGWFGGEPTLCTDVITSINSHAIANASEKTEFSSSISTNGVMLDHDLFRKLINVRVRLYQISLDGDRDQHNKTRVMQKGGATFDRILENVHSAVRTSYDFKIVLRLHIHDENLESMERLLSIIVDRFRRDPRVRVFFKAVERLGGPNDKSFPFVTKAGKLDELTSRANELGILERDSEPPACYAAWSNSLVIRADGRVGKCTVALRDERNTVGAITSDGSLRIDRDRFLPWIRGTLSGDESAMRCPLHGLPAAM